MQLTSLELLTLTIMHDVMLIVIGPASIALDEKFIDSPNLQILGPQFDFGIKSQVRT